MIHIVNLSHQILKQHPLPLVALDMTCGLGRDTQFLTDIAEKVYAFDIQASAIDATKALLSSRQREKVTFIHQSHHLFDDYVEEAVDIAIYNLGYLPGGPKDIKTDKSLVLQSLKKLLQKLNPDGLVVLVIYLHDFDESEAIETYVSGLDIGFDVMRYQVLNRTKSPYIISIHKPK
jgi:SAM-dependent methyltransferase